MGPELNTSLGNPKTFRNGDVIWITGEFFGVQRARDMLYQVSVNKVPFLISPSIFPDP